MNAEDQFRIKRKELAKPSEIMAAQGEPSLDVRTLLTLLERMASRIKTLEDCKHKKELEAER